MKIILVMFLFITSSQCGIIEDVDYCYAASKAGEVMRVTDAFVKGNVTFVTEILLDITKDKESHNICTITPIYPDDSGEESQSTNDESEIRYYHLIVKPGLHKWDVKYHVRQSADVNRINSIVEAAAKKTGQLVGKDCISIDDSIMFKICFFFINVGVTNLTLSNIHKREVQLQNDTVPAERDETKDNIEVDNSTAKQTASDIVYSVNNYSAQIAEDGTQDNNEDVNDAANQTDIVDNSVNNCTETITEDGTKVNHEDVNTAANQTDSGTSGSIHNCSSTVVFEGKVYCAFANTNALVGGCPTGTDRDQDGTCVEIIEIE